MDRDDLTGPVHKELLSRDVRLAQGWLEGLTPRPITSAVAAILEPGGVCPMVFLPQQTQGHVGTAEFFLHLSPVRNGPGSGRRCAVVQSALDFLLGDALGERPSQSGGLSPPEVIPDGAGREATTAGNLADGELVLMVETQDLDDLTHSDGFSSHTSTSLRRPTFGSTLRIACLQESSNANPNPPPHSGRQNHCPKTPECCPI